MTTLEKIYKEIANDPSNKALEAKGYMPVYTAAKEAKIVIIGQAPGLKAQVSGIPWNDVSGVKLRSWLGISDEQFYDPKQVALVPMDFYYPGKGAHGDVPPRKEFAPMWHPQILAAMPDVQLVILIGAYSQKRYLGKRAKANLTETVRTYKEYLPEFLPLVHPSPLNFRWLAKNPWFETDLVLDLRKRVRKILK